MSVVFALPSDLSSIVLSSWLNVIDLGRLDTSLCNRRLRIEFINLIASEDIRFRGFKARVDNGFLVWLKLRGILIDFVSINGSKVLDYQLLQSRNYLRNKLTAFKLSSFGRDVADVLGRFTFKFHGLTQLYLQRTWALTDAIVAEVTLNCPKLTLIDFTKCTVITSVSIQYIALHCSLVETLTLSGCDGIDALPHVVPHAIADIMVPTIPPLPVRINRSLPKLTSLNMSDCTYLKDSSFTFILANTDSTLTSVNVSGCPELRDDSLNGIASQCSTSLQSFNAQKCHLFNEAAMEQLVTRCSSSLRSLNLRNSRTSSDTLMTALVKHCKNLEELSIDGEFLHWRVTPALMMTVVEKLGQRLTRLCVSSEGITDTHLMAIGDTCTDLRHFMLIRESGPVLFTDGGLVELSRGCSLLESFVLEKNPFQEITNTTVNAVARHCPELRVFKLVGANKITSVMALADHCRHLQQVHVFDSILVSGVSVGCVCKLCPDLTTLSLAMETLSDDVLTPILDRQYPVLSLLHVKKCLAKYSEVSPALLTRAEKQPPKGLTVRFLPPVSL